jgi:hypothetical protein
VPFAGLDGVPIEPSEKVTAFKPPGSPTFRHRADALANPTFHVDADACDGSVRVPQEPGYCGPAVFLSHDTIAALWDSGLWERVRDNMRPGEEGVDVRSGWSAVFAQPRRNVTSPGRTENTW